MSWRDTRGATILRGVVPSSTATAASNDNNVANNNGTGSSSWRSQQPAARASNSAAARRVFSEPTYMPSSSSALLLESVHEASASNSRAPPSTSHRMLTTSPPVLYNTPRQKREDRYPGGFSVGSKSRHETTATISSRASRGSNQSSLVATYSPPRLTPAAAQKAAAAASKSSRSYLPEQDNDSQNSNSQQQLQQQTTSQEEDSQQDSHANDYDDDATSHYDDDDEEQEDDSQNHPQQQQPQNYQRPLVDSEADVTIDTKLQWGERRQKVALEKRNQILHQQNHKNKANYYNNDNAMTGGGGRERERESTAVYHLAHYNNDNQHHQQTNNNKGPTVKDVKQRRPTPRHRNNSSGNNNHNNMNDNHSTNSTANSTAANSSNKSYQKRLPLVMSASASSSDDDDDDDDDDDSSRQRRRRRRRLQASLSMTSMDDGLSNSSTLDRGSDKGMYLEGVFSDADDDYLKTKQSMAVLSIGLTCVQLLTLCLQLAMCGIATLDINPFVGPFPDAFVEWGGKNAYLMLVQDEWWRLVSPSLLHVGILHLLANAFCQLEPIALFEREWGSFRWLVLYIISSVGCISASSLYDPNTIAVGSSGTLMGLFSAKLAQVMSHAMFEVDKANQDEIIRLDQLSSVIIGLALVSLLSFFTYIDWSGHMGGLAAGFFSGMVLFCNPIKSCCIKILWAMLGLAGLISGFGYVFYFLLTETDPDEELGNACEYFRSLFPEGYECGCLW